MSVWALRGLRNGVVTTRWPRRPDAYAEAWRGPATVRPFADPALGPDPLPRAEPPRTADSADSAEPSLNAESSIGATPGGPVERLCPTGAIQRTDRVRIDQGRCILCGRCVASRPDLFTWSAGATGPGAAALARQALIVFDSDETDETDDGVAAARTALAARTTALRRSVHIRHVDAGSDGSAEWEIQALLGPVYDVHRLGVFFTASPRHADILLVTGAGAPGMIGPLRTTYEGMPDPKVVIAVGTDAISGGLFNDRLAGVAAHIPVDIWVPGDPPSPFGILNALLVATGRLR
jgi:Ni,Fe-hydrogenase III small subunit/ferredoxin